MVRIMQRVFGAKDLNMFGGQCPMLDLELQQLCISQDLEAQKCPIQVSGKTASEIYCASCYQIRSLCFQSQNRSCCWRTRLSCGLKREQMSWRYSANPRASLDSGKGGGWDEGWDEDNGMRNPLERYKRPIKVRQLSHYNKMKDPFEKGQGM
ncbi:hypothetical protein BT96DRAFT_947639 [Gymnopus androsaceus JB14]|uniref:Uncharacterized protein n=1 Tax=Gymnopus androsaceus JB14 TaxID=1447944 RepID=A0A6A4GSX0_9AGAR|nr:hypothetical protein BT96DRAFT_947639 [Gymnopus androsaceus JB14]